MPPKSTKNSKNAIEQDYIFSNLPSCCSSVVWIFASLTMSRNSILISWSTADSILAVLTAIFFENIHQFLCLFPFYTQKIAALFKLSYVVHTRIHTGTLCWFLSNFTAFFRINLLILCYFFPRRRFSLFLRKLFIYFRFNSNFVWEIESVENDVWLHYELCSKSTVLRTQPSPNCAVWQFNRTHPKFMSILTQINKNKHEKLKSQHNFDKKHL